ncbi:MAG: acyl-ACP--UDP-N-acetylglucosamine O-acyltransferase [Verrucomicrobiota bacterium]
MIHPTAIISEGAKVADEVEIGPYCVISDGVELGSGSVLKNNVTLMGPTRIGKNNLFHPYSVIGNKTQDLKYTGEPTYCEIGDDNEFREFVTVNRGTAVNEKTMIGSHNLFLTYSHIAHNCIVGNHTIFSNNATLAGHVIVEDYAILSGFAAAHQFCRIGRHSMVGGCTKIVQDVPPYFIADGNPAEVRSVNYVGLQRRGFSEEKVGLLRKALRALYDPSLNTSQAVEKLEADFNGDEEIQTLITFVRNSERGIIR